MTEHLDNREARDPQRRELDLMGHLPGLLAKALKSPGWQRHLGDVDTAQVNSRAALARLPLLRKSELPALQKARAPFGDSADCSRRLDPSTNLKVNTTMHGVRRARCTLPVLSLATLCSTRFRITWYRAASSWTAAHAA